MQPVSQPDRRRIRRGVIGILSRGARFLMIRRAPGLVRGGCWCFPGGHVEPGETPRMAIRRELAEELGIEVVPLRRLGSVRLPDVGYVLAVWRVRHVAGTFVPAAEEVADTRWVLADEIRSIQPGLPSNERVFHMLGA